MGCKRRTLEPNCHNVERCSDWKKFVEERERFKAYMSRQRDWIAVEARRSAIVEKQRREGCEHHE